MPSGRVHVLLAVVTHVTVTSFARGQHPVTPAQLGERIRNEFSPVWTRATDRPYTSDCSFEQFRLSGGEQRTQAITTRFRHGTEGRFATSMELTAFDVPNAKPYPSYVRATNPRYEFQLKKPFGGSGWLLVNWRAAGEEKPDYRIPVTYTPALLDPFQHLAFRGHPLDKLVAEPGWKVTAIQPSPVDAAQVRVTFTFAFTEPTASNAVHRYTGWLDLDPAAGWCIRRSEYRLQLEVNKVTVSKRFACENQYTVIEGSVPVLTSVQCNDWDVKPDGGFDNPQRRTFRFDTRYPDEVPEIEFTMTGFGLPEPFGVELPARRAPRYLWWLGGAGLCAALALGFRLVGRRGKQNRLPTSS